MGKIGGAIDTSQGRARPLALVVDNERMTRRLVREALEQSGLDVREAESGPQAIELFGSDRPDIVLVDVGMPRDGRVHDLRGAAGDVRRELDSHLAHDRS